MRKVLVMLVVMAVGAFALWPIWYGREYWVIPVLLGSLLVFNVACRVISALLEKAVERNEKEAIAYEAYRELGFSDMAEKEGIRSNGYSRMLKFAKAKKTVEYVEIIAYSLAVIGTVVAIFNSAIIHWGSLFGAIAGVGITVGFIVAMYLLHGRYRKN